MTFINNALSKLRTSILFIAAMLANNHAYSLINPEFELLINVVESSCGVVASEENKSVQLGLISNKVFYKIGSTSVTQSIPFQLTNCPPETPVSITITGTKAANHPEFLAISNAVNSASGVAIELLNADKQRLVLDEKNMFKSNKQGEISTLFYAHYIAINEHIGVGSAHATATFKIEHD